MELMNLSCEGFLEELASKAAAPGGGGASALVGAAGVALGSMVGSLTVGKKKYAAVEADIAALNVRAEALRKRLEALVQADAEAFLPVAAAYKLPKETPEQQAHKAAVLEKALENELEFLQQLGTAGLDDLCPEAPAFLPRWEVSPDANYAAAYQARRAAVGQKGYGMFARHHVFTIEDGRLVPVRYPDPQRLSELPGYEREREKVIANTRALLAGSPANNVLLYGDAGTGKSSTVKAIANEFAPDGLRLIEVKKNQLYQIPALMDELAKNPLKFILFIDDLSFASNDDNFAALKAILEGGVGGRSHNVAVYATSNRRHLVKETMADRSGDDLHAMDTRQELMSLSARFGLTVTFQQPDKDRYDRILLELAKQYNVQMPSDQLFIKGAAFALRAGGRSPRVAKQFVELLAAGVKV